MSDNSKNKNGNRPSHSVYFLKEVESQDKPVWVKVGVGWAHKDKSGLNLVLENLGQEIALVARQNTSQTPKPQ